MIFFPTFFATKSSLTMLTIRVEVQEISWSENGPCAGRARSLCGPSGSWWYLKFRISWTMQNSEMYASSTFEEHIFSNLIISYHLSHWSWTSSPKMTLKLAMDFSTWSSTFNLNFNSNHQHGKRWSCWTWCALQKCLWHFFFSSAWFRRYWALKFLRSLDPEFLWTSMWHISNFAL